MTWPSSRSPTLLTDERAIPMSGATRDDAGRRARGELPTAAMHTTPSFTAAASPALRVTQAALPLLHAQRAAVDANRDAIDLRAGRVARGLLREAGTAIPTNDLWIAASAMQHGLCVVTTDGHFRSVKSILLQCFDIQ